MTHVKLHIHINEFALDAEKIKKALTCNLQNLVTQHTIKKQLSTQKCLNLEEETI